MYDLPQDCEVTGAWGTTRPTPPASMVGEGEHLPLRSSTSLVLVAELLILRIYTWDREENKILILQELRVILH